MRKRILTVMTITVLMLVVGASLGGAAFADAGSAASCVGIEASSISAPGTSDEFPGGMPELNGFVRSLGVPLGPVYSAIAKLHEGSHEGCDEATE